YVESLARHPPRPRQPARSLIELSVRIEHVAEIEKRREKIGRAVDRLPPQDFSLVVAIFHRQLLGLFGQLARILHRQREHGYLNQLHFTNGSGRVCPLDSTSNTSCPAAAPGNCSIA